jgi:hypothetical protein
MRRELPQINSMKNLDNDYNSIKAAKHILLRGSMAGKHQSNHKINREILLNQNYDHEVIEEPVFDDQPRLNPRKASGQDY